MARRSVEWEFVPFALDGQPHTGRVGWGRARPPSVANPSHGFGAGIVNEPLSLGSTPIKYESPWISLIINM